MIIIIITIFIFVFTIFPPFSFFISLRGVGGLDKAHMHPLNLGLANMLWTVNDFS